MRNFILTICAGVLMLALSVTNASAQVTCNQTEKKGCLEIDVLNLLWDPSVDTMVGLDQPYRSQEERYYRVLELGPNLWDALKDGDVQEARTRTFTIYMWNVGTLSTDYMSEYRLPSGARNVSRLTRHKVTEVAPEFGAIFDPIFDLGMPQRAFEITVTGPGTGLQFPWSMIGGNTYILVCSGDEDGIYPNRQNGASEGLWLTPEYLTSIQRDRWDYVLLPFVSLR